MKSTCRKNVSETAAAGYLLAWNLTYLAGSPSKCTRPVIREWNRPNNVQDLSRADEQIQINAEAKVLKVSSRKVAPLVPSQCLGNTQLSALFKTPTVVMFSLLIYLWALYSVQRWFSYMALFLTVNSICIDLSLSNFKEIKTMKKMDVIIWSM